jgi:TatD DNase family protein
MSRSTHPTNADHADSAERACPGWFDAHNHLHDPRFGEDCADLVASQRAAGISGCVVNATCEDDWPRVAELAREFPDFVLPAFGIHPWKAHAASPGWQDRLLDFLDTFPNASIGECGIDSWVHSPSLDRQISIFLDHLRIARETDRTLTIHCLKAWGALFDCFNKQPPPQHFLMHSFGGSLETAHRLLPLGAYFSFSGHFLHERKRNILSVFRNLPEDRILLETDAPDMLPPDAHVTHPLPNGINHPANLPAIGIALATGRAIQPETLARQLETNTRDCFGG